MQNTNYIIETVCIKLICLSLRLHMHVIEVVHAVCYRDTVVTLNVEIDHAAERLLLILCMYVCSL